MDDRGATALASAIVCAGVLDWYVCVRMIAERNGTGREVAATQMSNRMISDPDEELRRLNRFFTGPWFHTISDLDGKELLRLMEENPWRRFRGTAVVEAEAPAKARRFCPERAGMTWKKARWQRMPDPELRKLMVQNGIRVLDIAAEIHVTASAVSGWMARGLRKSEIELIRRMAEKIIREREEKRIA